MKRLFVATALVCSVALGSAVYADEPVPEKFELKDGSMLYVHPDGTHRMVDEHGKAMTMANDVEMELMDGRMVMMKNRKMWVSYGPPGKGTVILKDD